MRIIKSTALVLAFVLFEGIAAPAVSRAASLDRANDAALRSAISAVFSKRERQVMGGDGGLPDYYVPNSPLLSHELSRPSRFRQFESRYGPIVAVRSTPNVRRLSVAANTASSTVYEWTFFDWVYQGRVITTGFGVEHEMTWGLQNGQWVVLKDAYDEGPLTGVRSPDCPPDQKSTAATNASSVSSPVVQSPVTGIVTPQSFISYPYWRKWAAGYADAFVYHQAHGGTTYDQYYNNDHYFNCNSIGGDCTNYVSQAMHEGGYAPFVSFGVDSASAWWYDNRGTEPNLTEDDRWSLTWVRAPAHRTMIQLLGWGYDTQGSSLREGDVVYYAWHGGEVDHAAIVSISASDNGGLALVDSHNNDYYHAPWDYGYVDTVHYPVAIFDELLVWIP